MATPNSTTTTTKKAKIDSIHLYIYIYIYDTHNFFIARTKLPNRETSIVPIHCIFVPFVSIEHRSPSSFRHINFHPFVQSNYIYIHNTHSREASHTSKKILHSHSSALHRDTKKNKTYFKMKQTRENIHTKK